MLETDGLGKIQELKHKLLGYLVENSDGSDEDDDIYNFGEEAVNEGEF